MLATTSITASAASTDSCRIANGIFSGSCSMGADSGSASSSYTTNAGLSVAVRYDYTYGSGDQNYNQVTSRNGNTSTYVDTVARACSNHTNITSVRVEAVHNFSYNGRTGNF